MRTNRFLRTGYGVIQVSRVLFMYVWYRWVTYYLVGCNRDAEFEQVHKRAAALLFRTFSRLRGAYIKLAQFLSTQAFLPAAYLTEFAKLQDQVEPVHFAKIQSTLREEWGSLESQWVAQIAPTPLAAASIAQVHRAMLRDGREVVLKVQYPGIERFFTADLALVKRLLPWYIAIIASSFPKLRTSIDYRALIGELFAYIAKELDYQNEVHWQTTMAEFFAGWKTVKVPAVVVELCTQRVICMEYVGDAHRILDWFSTATQEDRDMVFETFVDVLLYTIVVKGCFQSDSHPGNYLVTNDKRLVLLDFGCVKELRPDFRSAIIKILQAFINRDTRTTAELLSALGFRTANGLVESFENWVRFGYKVADLVVEHFARGHDLAAHLRSNLAVLAREVMSLNRSHAIAHVPTEYMLLGRALATVPVPLDKFTPQIDILSLVIEHLASQEAEAALD